MADKYIIEGAAFNGDGTSSAAATVAGGVGAWNTIAYFEGATPAYGSIGAGDTVYIRSKTAAGADIARTLSANLIVGSANATDGVSISWFLDNGKVWPGVDGVLTYNCPSTFVVTFRIHNNFTSMTAHNIRVVEQNPIANSKYLITYSGNQVLDGICFDASVAITAGNGMRLHASSGDYRPVVLKNLKIIVGTHLSPLVYVGQGARLKLINPDIELINASEKDPIFGMSSGGGLIEVIGGRVHGVGANTDKALCSSGSAGHVRIVGLQYPQTMQVYPSKTAQNSNAYGFTVSVFGADNGMGSCISERWGDADSRSDGYYPTLNARIPNSILSGWSWKVHSPNGTKAGPGNLIFSKILQEDAAQKAVTLEMLLADSLDAVANQSNTYITVSYIDAATGSSLLVSSQENGLNPSSLNASSAGWSSTSWGATNFLKKKISVQTPTAIKKDTAVIVTFWVEFSVDSTLKPLFVCPDVLLS